MGFPHRQLPCAWRSCTRPGTRAAAALATDSWGSAVPYPRRTEHTHTLPVGNAIRRRRQPRLGPGMLASVGPMERAQKRRSGSLRQSPPISAQLISWGVSWKQSALAAWGPRLCFCGLGAEGSPGADPWPSNNCRPAVTFFILFLSQLVCWDLLSALRAASCWVPMAPKTPKTQDHSSITLAPAQAFAVVAQFSAVGGGTWATWAMPFQPVGAWPPNDALSMTRRAQGGGENHRFPTQGPPAPKTKIQDPRTCFCWLLRPRQTRKQTLVAVPCPHTPRSLHCAAHFRAASALAHALHGTGKLSVWEAATATPPLLVGRRVRNEELDDRAVNKSRASAPLCCPSPCCD